MMIGSVLTAPLSSRLGRRWTSILGIGLVYIISYLLFVFPVNMGLLYISRLLMGVGLGVSQTLSTIYIAEVSTKDTRASLAVIPAMTGCLGVNTCQVLGKYLDYRMMSLVFTCINIPFIIMMLLIPESPTFLVSRNRMEEAEKELRRLRGGGWDVVKESLEIKKQLQGDTDNKSKEKSSLFRTELFQPHVIKPLVVSICLMFFFQMSGINLIMMYAPRIFMEVTNIDAFTANIMMGAALFVSNVVTLIIAGKCPRRIMLLISSLGCALTLAVMGVSYEITDLETECRNKTDILEQIINDADDDLVDLCSFNVDWLPVLNSMFFIFVFSLGYGSMIWMTVVEILPPSIRGWTNGSILSQIIFIVTKIFSRLAVGWVGALSFITTFTFPYLLASVSGKVAFWIYASISFLGFLFIAMFVPETRGKTEDEIKHFFESQNKETSDKSKASELH